VGPEIVGGCWDDRGVSELEIHHNDPGRFWASPGPALADALVAVMTRIRAEYAVLLELVGELDGTDIHRLAGYGSTAQLLSALTRVSPKQAKRLLAQAEQVCPTVTPTGHVSPPPLPATRAALVDAVIDGEHVEVIARAMREIPAWVDPEAREGFERALADEARTADPAQLRACADRMLTVLDQDGPEPDDTPAPPLRNCLSWRKRRDGRVRGVFELCPTDGATFVALMGPLSKPASPDLRSQAERNGDALAEICDLALSAPDLTTEAGERPHLNVTIPLAALESRIGRALLDGAATLNAAQTRTVACDAKVIPYVLGGSSQPLDVGRARYTIPTQIRRALILRDRGCAFPRCDRRPRACAGHHVVHWADRGSTSLNNLVLLCPRHHRLIHNSDWDVTIASDGVPEFTPPAYLDQHRRTLRSSAYPQSA
jgi:hypothetical protein